MFLTVKASSLETLQFQNPDDFSSSTTIQLTIIISTSWTASCCGSPSPGTQQIRPQLQWPSIKVSWLQCNAAPHFAPNSNTMQCSFTPAAQNRVLCVSRGTTPSTTTVVRVLWSTKAPRYIIGTTPSTTTLVRVLWSTEAPRYNVLRGTTPSTTTVVLWSTEAPRYITGRRRGRRRLSLES